MRELSIAEAYARLYAIGLGHFLIDELMRKAIARRCACDWQGG